MGVTLAKVDLSQFGTGPGWDYSPDRYPGRTPVNLRCPECKKIAGLGDHSVAADGTVSPSVVCAHKGCSFHEFVSLEGWVPPQEAA